MVFLNFGAGPFAKLIRVSSKKLDLRFILCYLVYYPSILKSVLGIL